jgi:hypothetical protein
MLRDRERETLREIQRQFLIEDPGFARSFRSVDHSPPHGRCRRARTSAIVLTLGALVLAGPRILTEAEVTARKMPPAPRTSSPSHLEVSVDYVAGPD